MSPLHGTTPIPLPRCADHRTPSPPGERIDLPAIATSVAAARTRVRSRLDHWGLEDSVRDTALLVVSELVTNVILHTRSDRVVCWVVAQGSGVRIEVTDQGHGMAPRVPRQASSEAEGGRGLLLLDALAVRWGVIPPGHVSGCTVWAEIRP
ncbi:ATP-binding protein [Streptomyces hainanensis]|uniref:ATP-binding protein n=1 Tax=Streptomyces hainanensis TaxID=402648 RepID=UPI001404AA31|nr:ATP-binding protein [Streptomyces hainanensis]